MELAITLDQQSAVPLHRQLYDELRRAILSGRLRPGERVPSTRALARSLRVSRTTVTQGYDQLLSEGYLQAVIGSGTTVCTHLPDDLARPLPVAQASARRPAPALRLSDYGRSLAEAESFALPEPEPLINFKTGRPAFDHFPLRLWRRLMLRHLRHSEAALLDYAGSSQGYEPLREAIAGYLRRSRAAHCEAGQIIIVSGSQQALDLTARLLINRGDLVAVEDPGYLGARRAFLAQGARLLPVPVDEAGIIVERLKAQQNRPAARLLYVTPSHQFPTGAVLSLPRRIELLAWAEASGALIIEDDYDSEFRYDSRPIPALQGLARSDAVIYAGTFSKVLAPGLRIGYLVVPPSLAPLFTQARWLADRHSALLEQRVLTDFITEGHLERHLRRMRVLYDQRRQALVRALEQHFADRVQILGENAGLHLMIRLRTRLSAAEVVARAASAGVGLLSAQASYLRADPKTEFILGYSSLSERKIRDGIRRLASVITK